ncbi:beta carbonic anhydrase 5, chloroplastic-like isoform X1 [Syzygium oleosum]|uniref:beta carbonic anhydrase 5, chloroplastic-like isoform X1 n=1 Tax=Syzygium oleosum TaxID=219896 RepID=UPI0024BA525F|nr:beta carbonic anhydrase 5, chloroplastic-like isoform X1 [Syzygium oleosum]
MMAWCSRYRVRWINLNRCFTSLTPKWNDVSEVMLESFEDSQITLAPSKERKEVIPSDEIGSPRITHQQTRFTGKDLAKAKGDGSSDMFDEIRQRFLEFKNNKFLKEAAHFQNLARAQSPKFMVIACVDSRVCPTNVLGLQPGEAFMVRNVANLVPAIEFGTSETGAALEFAVKALEVENILVIGHSRCAGIEALMGMQDSNPRNYVERWVINGKAAKLRTEATAPHLSFDQQCIHCEKESVTQSLNNLLTYPWIKERVEEGLLSISGGYYDFADCTFEKWTLDIERSGATGGKRYPTKDHQFWC